MMKTQVFFYVFLFVVGTLTVPQSFACTGLRLKAADDGIVVGRTLEFGLDPKSEILVMPAGTKIHSSLPDKSKGIEYTSKYGIVGANGFNFDIHFDGINEVGLYVSGYYFYGYASYHEADPEKYDISMAAEDYGTWLLANFSSVEEVKTNFDKVYIVEHPIDQIGKISFPAHFVIHDQTGACVVIEPLNIKLNGESTKKMVIYDNPLGVITNSPTFDWHMTNLSNYINLSIVNVDSVDIKDNLFKSLGQGNGLHGLPGDGTPQSRFVRATVYSLSAVQQKTAELTVPQIFHLLNNFDIPFGSVREVSQDSIMNEKTFWTSVSDLKNLTYSIKTYDGQQVLQVDVKRALSLAKHIVHIEMNDKFTVKDISTAFKD